MSAEPSKQYGLFLTKRGVNPDIIQRPAIFDEDSDSGANVSEGLDWIKKVRQRESLKSVDKKQIQKALIQDPTIYQYDEVYDNIKEKETPPKKEEKKQSRYIQSLKRHAERRKLENERRMERQVQKEREVEGEEFKDKEAFVTSSYKKKLEEFKKMDEEEKQMDRLEEIGDVTKQKDMSGFWRHLYKTTVDADKTQEKTDSASVVNQELKVSKSPPKELTKDPIKAVEDPLTKHKRQYRKRTKSASSKEEGENTTSSSSSSSTSSSSSSSDSEDNKKVEKKNSTRSKSPERKRLALSHIKENKDVLPTSTNEDKKDNKKKKTDSPVENEKETNEVIVPLTDVNKVSKVPDATVNIWLKRTVGETFEASLQRYLERKANRQGLY